MTNTVISPPAMLRLRGHDPRPAAVPLERRPRQTRVTKSILSVLGFFILAPIVAFIPPHIPWVLLAVGAGIYFGYRQWVGEYIVHGFSGQCPRCGNELSIETGSKIKLPLGIDCFECHHTPELTVEGAAA